MSEMYIQNMIPGYFPIFTDVFSQWFSLIERYNQQRPDDVPWWYNERASLSFFAGAVWNSGGIALEEYSTGKSHKKESWPGRGDLYIKIKEEEYVIEAKQVWTSMSSRAQKTKEKVEAALLRARRDAGKTNSWGARRLGLVFVIPYIKRCKESEFKVCVNDWLTHIKSVEKASQAWILFEKLETRFRYKTYFYPGVAVILRALKSLGKP